MSTSATTASPIYPCIDVKQNPPGSGKRQLHVTIGVNPDFVMTSLSENDKEDYNTLLDMRLILQHCRKNEPVKPVEPPPKTTINPNFTRDVKRWDDGICWSAFMLRSRVMKTALGIFNIGFSDEKDPFGGKDIAELSIAMVPQANRPEIGTQAFHTFIHHYVLKMIKEHHALINGQPLKGIRATVHPSNSSAIALYESCGFTPVLENQSTTHGQRHIYYISAEKLGTVSLEVKQQTITEEDLPGPVVSQR